MIFFFFLVNEKYHVLINKGKESMSINLRNSIPSSPRNSNNNSILNENINCDAKSVLDNMPEIQEKKIINKQMSKEASGAPLKGYFFTFYSPF